MHKHRDVSHIVDHPYFRGLEERHEKGTGLVLALEEMAARTGVSPPNIELNAKGYNPARLMRL